MARKRSKKPVRCPPLRLIAVLCCYDCPHRLGACCELLDKNIFKGSKKMNAIHPKCPLPETEDEVREELEER